MPQLNHYGRLFNLIFRMLHCIRFIVGLNTLWALTVSLKEH